MFKVVNLLYKSIIARGRYCRIYEVGNIVNAEKESFGLMIFKNIDEAIKFGKDICVPFRILEVKPIGKQFIPTKISSCGSEWWISTFYDNQADNNLYVSARPGTICFPSLKVIRELENHQERGVIVWR